MSVSADDFVDAVENLTACMVAESNSRVVSDLSEGMRQGLNISEVSQTPSSRSPAPLHDRKNDGLQSPTPGLLPATPSTEMTTATRGNTEQWAQSPTMKPGGNSSIGTMSPELDRSDPTPKPQPTEEETSGHAAGSSHDDGEAVSRPRYSTEDIDTILEQLNVLESDYEAQVATLKDELKTKDAVLRALSDQIAESQNRNDALIEQLTEHARSEDRLREEAALGSGVIMELRDELVRMEDDHELVLAEQRRYWEGEVMKAEEAVKAEAERQFTDANACFLRLKAEHEAVTSERNTLAEEARKAAAIASREERKAKGREAELLAESAELRAALATAEAQVAVERRARVESLRVAEEREAAAQDDLAVSRVECSAMQRSLATVVAEKEKVAAENRELQAMCEELMAIVEGGGGEGASS
eukprot:CAMPEP_0113544322 /NCGR_PEP_ID=MMETSP0015_2-20120614/10643_1 /TAXON_ID=2838 /ORGANISM="Odontella" /LENGTH=415 /DNA_ID=CAMNT_0000444567 /DNA_START=485 /DNA_END=1732 /DNA_ORIENTATION=- /assembly_acc=CAM_ASM_000160